MPAIKKTTAATKKTVATKVTTTPQAVEAAAKKLKAAKAVSEPKAALPAVKAKKPAAPAKAKSPAAAPSASDNPVTKVVAVIDVGFGNHLTIRGQGPGLSWDEGVVMTCADGTCWVWSTSEATEPITFKVLANDSAWCAGDDIIVSPGTTVTVTPLF